MQEEPYDPYGTGPMPSRTPTACRDFARGNGDDERLWADFFRVFSPGMRRLAKSVVVPRGLPAEDANDVVMVAAEKFLGNAIVRRNVPNGRLTPLVSAVTRNVAYDFLRKCGPRSRPERPFGDAALLSRETVTPERDLFRLRIAAMGFVLDNALRPDFPNGEYDEEYDGELLAALACIRDDRAKLREIASAANVRLWRAGQLKDRAWSRLLRDGEALLASLNLI